MKRQTTLQPHGMDERQLSVSVVSHRIGGQVSVKSMIGATRNIKEVC